MTFQDSAEAGATPQPRRRALTIGLIVVAALIAGLVIVAGRSGTPTDASPEAGFARDMGTHHAQAVEMSFIVRDASSDPALRTLAYDIITTQSAQRGMFIGWLQQWGLNQASSRPAMAWMTGHSHSGGQQQASGGMPGMASQDEMNRLKAAKGKDAEVLFLQLMIRHHEGGVEMARGVLALSDRPEVRELAQHIIDGQSAEIDVMKEFLKQRGAQPLPSILSTTG